MYDSKVLSKALDYIRHLQDDDSERLILFESDAEFEEVSIVGVKNSDSNLDKPKTTEV